MNGLSLLLLVLLFLDQLLPLFLKLVPGFLVDVLPLFGRHLHQLSVLGVRVFLLQVLHGLAHVQGVRRGNPFGLGWVSLAPLLDLATVLKGY